MLKWSVGITDYGGWKGVALVWKWRVEVMGLEKWGVPDWIKGVKSRLKILTHFKVSHKEKTKNIKIYEFYDSYKFLSLLLTLEAHLWGE